MRLNNRYNQNQLVIHISLEDNHKQEDIRMRSFSLAALTALELPPLQLIEVASACGFERVGLRPAISPLPDRLLSAALARRMGLSLWAVACLKHHDVLTLHPDNRLGRHDEGRGCDD